MPAPHNDDQYPKNLPEHVDVREDVDDPDLDNEVDDHDEAEPSNGWWDAA